MSKSVDQLHKEIVGLVERRNEKIDILERQVEEMRQRMIEPGQIVSDSGIWGAGKSPGDLIANDEVMKHFRKY